MSTSASNKEMNTPTEYTPTTSDIRRNIPSAYIAPDEFDRWLESTMKAVAFKAVEAGIALAQSAVLGHESVTSPQSDELTAAIGSIENPYSLGASQ